MSFSLQTANKLNTQGFNSINFRAYDVHPPTHYIILALWERINPGLTSYHWGQELSVLYAVIFLIFAGLALSKIFGNVGTVSVILLALCTTYLHYGTEVRMYSLLMMMSVIIFYSITIQDMKGKWRWVASICLFMLPMTQYFGAIAVPFFVGLYYVLSKKRGTYKPSTFWMLLTAGILGTVLALTYAIPQARRVAGSWFAPPSPLDWPSSVMYAFFMTDLWVPTGILVYLFLALYVSLAAFLVWLVYKLYRTLSTFKKEEGISEEKIILIFMFLTALFPLGGLFAAPVLGGFVGQGLAHLYHHRFFLVLTWMFAAATFILIWRSLSKKIIYVVILSFIMVFGLFGMFYIYQKDIVHHELRSLMDATPCPTGNQLSITIAHESPFSALPYDVWARQKGCNWIDIVSTNMSQRALNGGGGDAMPPGTIYLNQTLPATGNYYVVYAAGTVPIDGIPSKIHMEDGVELWYVQRSNTRVGTQRYIWYDNTTEYQYTRVEWCNADNSSCTMADAGFSGFKGVDISNTTQIS